MYGEQLRAFVISSTTGRAEAGGRAAGRHAGHGGGDATDVFGSDAAVLAGLATTLSGRGGSTVAVRLGA
ncbi:hypothetical protein I546_7354 [Mycobacterium kansasii 732]|nr:hypothetical protein I546_7354 [Mycobacterium kansasii 732]